MNEFSFILVDLSNQGLSSCPGDSGGGDRVQLRSNARAACRTRKSIKVRAAGRPAPSGPELRSYPKSHKLAERLAGQEAIERSADPVGVRDQRGGEFRRGWDPGVWHGDPRRAMA